MILGVDEAGRGAWAGPVVAACVGWGGRCPVRGLADSKILNSSQREKLYARLQYLQSIGVVHIGVGIIDVLLIDEVGIREANRRAMDMAINCVYNPDAVSEILIDGCDNYIFSDIPTPRYIIRGDSSIRQIMAASIIAKVTRDMIMDSFDTQFAGYFFAHNKGYGTRKHQDALSQLGICEIHRKSYAPIKAREEESRSKSRLQTADSRNEQGRMKNEGCRQQTADSRLQTADSRQQKVDFRHKTGDRRQRDESQLPLGATTGVRRGQGVYGGRLRMNNEQGIMNNEQGRMKKMKVADGRLQTAVRPFPLLEEPVRRGGGERNAE